MPLYLAAVIYDGSEFIGWAKQPQQFTVQGCIEKVLSKIFQQKISILAASRTDKGVHALDQKFTFRLSLPFSPQRLEQILTKSLKKYVTVKKVYQVKNSLHPIKNVIKKEYRYYINTGEYNHFAQKYRWEYNSPLSTKKLNNILNVFQGEHDFFNFSHCRQKDRTKIKTVRTIEKIRCWKRKNILIISVIGKSFLRYQIRAIIGESIKCYEFELKSGSKELTTQAIKKKLFQSDKLGLKYRFLAPAGGLYLWKITYSWRQKH